MRLNTLTLLPLAAAHPWAKRAEPAPLVTSENIDESDIIADQYIVKFKDDASIAAAIDGAVSILSVTPDHVYAEAINGFAATLDKDTLEALREHPDVDYIEKNVVVRSNAYVTQEDVPWGLARISHRALGPTSYTYDDSAGEGTCSYIVDTGIDVSHPVSFTLLQLQTSLTPCRSSRAAPPGSRTSSTTTTQTRPATPPTSPAPSAPRPTASQRRPASTASRSSASAAAARSPRSSPASTSSSPTPRPATAPTAASSTCRSASAARSRPPTTPSTRPLPPTSSPPSLRGTAVVMSTGTRLVMLTMSALLALPTRPTLVPRGPTLAPRSRSLLLVRRFCPRSPAV